MAIRPVEESTMDKRDGIADGVGSDMRGCIVPLEEEVGERL